MKILIIFLTALLSIAGFADSFKVVKILDGTVRDCKSQADVSNDTFQSYSLKTIALNRNNDDSINVSFNINMKSCKKIGNQFTFVDVNPFEDFTYNVTLDFDDNNQPIFNTVTAQTTELRGSIHQDGSYKLLFNSAIKGGVNFNLNLEDLLTNDELYSLNNGNKVRASFDFNLQRKLLLNSPHSEQHQHSITYGGFRFNVLLKKRNGEMLVKFL